MSNVINAIQSVASTIYYGLLSLVYHPFTWGFIFGLLISTLIHLFFLMVRPPLSPSLFQTLKLPTLLKKQHWYSDFRIDYLLLRVTFFFLLILLFIFIFSIFIRFTPTG